MELKEIKKLFSNNNGISFMATSIRTRTYRCLEFFFLKQNGALKKKKNRCQILTAAMTCFIL